MSYNYFVKYIEWNWEKNEKLKKERGIGFEEIVLKIFNEEVLDDIENPSQNFPKQRVFVVSVGNYIFYIPYVEDKEKIFLKTIIPSRKATKRYLEK